jgi:hypothetical protein
MELAKINSKPDALGTPRIIVFFKYGTLILPTTDVPAVCTASVRSLYHILWKRCTVREGEFDTKAERHYSANEFCGGAALTRGLVHYWSAANGIAVNSIVQSWLLISGVPFWTRVADGGDTSDKKFELYWRYSWLNAPFKVIHAIREYVCKCQCMTWIILAGLTVRTFF